MSEEQSDDVREALEQEKERSTAQLLFKAARLMDAYAVSRVRELWGIEGLRSAHTSLLPHIDLDGTRVTTLSERVGVSKQAISQLVGELEEMGVVERVADPDDGRAKLVVFVEDGAHLIEGVRALQAIEQDIWSELGGSEKDMLHEILVELVPILERAQDA